MGRVEPRALPRKWNVGGNDDRSSKQLRARARVWKALEPNPNAGDCVQDLRYWDEVGKGRRRSIRVAIEQEQRALPTRPRSASC